MLILITAIAIIGLIYFVEKSNSKDIEIRKLKKRIKDLEKQLDASKSKPVGVSEKIEKSKPSNEVKILEQPQKIEINNYRVSEKADIKKEKTEQEKRNITIMTTGAVLVILAAIVFLRSTWGILSDAIKAVGLMLFIVIFYAASVISKEKFKLEDTSKTFFYLAMAYIPIYFLSLSVMGLLGDYLSIYGEGVYLYMFVSSAITSAVYYYFYVKRKNIVIFYGSLIAQTTSMVMLALVISKDIQMITLMLLAYNFIICLLCPNYAKDLIYLYVQIVTYLGMVVAISFFIEKNIVVLTIYVLVIMDFIAIILKFNNNKLNSYLFNLLLYCFGFYVIITFLKGLNANIQVVLMITLFSIIYYLENTLLKNNKQFSALAYSASIINAISVACVYYLVKTSNDVFIKPFMVAVVEVIFLLIMYLKADREDHKLIISYLITIVTFIILHELLVYIKWWDYIYIAVALCIIGEIARLSGSKDISQSFIVGTTITTIVSICNIAYAVDYNLVTRALAFAINLYYLIKTKKHIFKYLTYSAFGILVLKSIKIDVIRNWLYILPLVLSVIIVLLELFIKKLRDEFSDIYIYVLQVIAYIALFILNSGVTITIAFVYTIFMYIYAVYEKEKIINIVISLLGLMTIILSSKIADEYSVMWKMAYIVVLVLISAFRKKTSVDTVFSGIMLLNFLLQDIQNNCIAAMYLTVWSFANIFIASQDEFKDAFKFITIVSIAYLYKAVLDEFNVSEQSLSVYFIGYVLALIIAMEMCIKKYVSADNYSILEYVLFGFIYLSVIAYYKDELDGLIFVAYLIIDAMYLSQKDKGNRFKVNIAAIIINAFMLTRKFWLLLPWWIYLLGAGCGLIGFATINESRNHKKNNNLKK